MEKTQTCKNCGASVQKNYCSDCGQSTSAGRINSHYLWHEVQHSILHVDRGIFYTIKELILRPGITIKGYLDGKRVNHFKPFAFVIILGTIYGFIAHFFKVYPESELLPDLGPESTESGRKVMEWVYGHYSLVMLGLIPFTALASYWVFRKKGYNYSEYLVIYSYITGIQILILLLAYPFYYSFSSLEIVLAALFFVYLYYVWVFVQLFSKDLWIITVIKTIFSFIITFVIVFLLMIPVIIIVSIFNHATNV